MSRSIPADVLAKATAAGNTIRALAVVTTGVAEEARSRHQTAPTATAALGRVMTAGLLIGSMMKEEEQLSIQFMGNGPLQGLVTDANARGEVRGFVYQPRAHLPIKNGKLDVGGVVGEGTMAVVRRQHWDKEPYRSVLPIVSGEIGQDIANYLLTSEQVPSAVSLGVFVRPDEVVSAAGGFIIQAMPDADEATLARIEEAVAQARPVSQMVRDGLAAWDMLRQALADFSPTLLDEMPVRFACRCSRERVHGIIVALGAEEVEELLEKEGQISAACEFCAEQYAVGSEEARALVADARR